MRPTRPTLSRMKVNSTKLVLPPRESLTNLLWKMWRHGSWFLDFCRYFRDFPQLCAGRISNALWFFLFIIFFLFSFRKPRSRTAWGRLAGYDRGRICRDGRPSFASAVDRGWGGRVGTVASPPSASSRLSPTRKAGAHAKALEDPFLSIQMVELTVVSRMLD